MEIVYNIAYVGQMVSCYTTGNCMYIGIRSGGWGVPKGQQSHLQKRKVVLRERVPEEVIKENIKRKTKIIVFVLLKRNIISIRATEVILVIKRNNNKQIRERCSS